MRKRWMAAVALAALLTPLPLSGEEPGIGGQAVDGALMVHDLGRLVLRRGATLSGTVTDPEGRPLEKVRLDTAWASAVTGPDGSFEIPHVEPGRLQAEAEGYLRESRAVCRFDEPLHLTLWPRGSRQIPGPDGKPVAGTGLFADSDPGCPPGISGRVLDPGGTPLVEALVTAYLDEGGADSALLERDGSFLISPEPPGPLLLTIRADGYEGLRQRIEAASGEVRVVAVLEREDSLDCEPGGQRIVPGSWSWMATLAPSGQAPETEPAPFFLITPVPARGRVIGPDGAPVAGALVGATRSEESARSAADGSFEIQVPAHFLEEITASREGFAVGWVYVDPGGAPVEDLEIRLGPASAVTGHVLGLAAGEPDPEEGEVTLQGKEGPPFSAPLQADGAFRLTQIPPGSWELSTKVSGREAAARILVQPGQDVRVDLQLPAVHPVSGQVLDERGQPLAEARIAAWWEVGMQTTSAETDADGRFALALPDGEYYLQVRKRGYQEGGQRGLVIRGEPVSGLVFRLERATTLRVRLLGVAPGQRAGVEAEPVPGQPGHSPWEIEEEAGATSMHDLRPGLWRIWAGTSDCTRRKTIEIPPGTLEMELDLDLGFKNEEEP